MCVDRFHHAKIHKASGLLVGYLFPFIGFSAFGEPLALFYLLKICIF
jgi:hypothetical protein